ncbi:uncharacterized protein LOC134229662 isoform X2 [Saccostrea cucullata]|uniref:uncharacterized protein LOC134229662 isoform X2 n=1 Tax=Saccostrea cuccullata TaxID=36930 RepID=UPI002ECFBE2A
MLQQHSYNCISMYHRMSKYMANIFRNCKTMLSSSSLSSDMMTNMKMDLKLGGFAFMRRKYWGHRDDDELLPDTDRLSSCTTCANASKNVTSMNKQTIRAFQPAKYKNYFLCNDSGKLVVRKVLDFRIDERCHFTETNSTEFNPCCSNIYTFQSRNDQNVYLGVHDEKTFGLIDTNSTSAEWETTFYLRRCENSPIYFLKPSKELIVLCDRSSEGEFNFTIMEDKVAADPELKYDFYENQGLVMNEKPILQMANLIPFTCTNSMKVDSGLKYQAR